MQRKALMFLVQRSKMSLLNLVDLSNQGDIIVTPNESEKTETNYFFICYRISLYTQSNYSLILDPISKTFSEGRLKYFDTLAEFRPKKSNNASRMGLIPVSFVITTDSLPRK